MLSGPSLWLAGRLTPAVRQQNNRPDYYEYLASREWAILKREVHKRSRGRCERCGQRDGTQVHHLNYRRLGNETLTDLQHVCTPCHEYLSAVSNLDPLKACCTEAEAEAWADDLYGDALYAAAVRHLDEIRALAR